MKNYFRVIIACFVFSLIHGFSFAQNTGNSKNENETFISVEEMPEFPGGEDALMQFIAKETKYPRKAKRKNITGTVFVGFVVDQNGNVTNVEVKRGVKGKKAGLLHNEAIRVVRSLPKWKPGKQGGKNVSVGFIVPIKFSLLKKN